jgi:hypothetical protein
MVGDKLMGSLIVWSLGLVAQTVRRQSLVRNEKENARKMARSKQHGGSSPRPMGCRAAAGAVENEFHFQDARMVF